MMTDCAADRLPDDALAAENMDVARIPSEIVVKWFLMEI